MSGSHALLSVPIMSRSSHGNRPSSTNVVASTIGSAEHHLRASIHVVPKDLVAAWPLGPRSQATTRLPESVNGAMVQVIILLRQAKRALVGTARAIVIPQPKHTSMGLHPTRR